MTLQDCTNPTTPVCGKKGTANYDECIGCKSDDDCLGIPTGPFCDTDSVWTPLTRALARTPAHSCAPTLTRAPGSYLRRVCAKDASGMETALGIRTIRYAAKGLSAAPAMREKPGRVARTTICAI